jgi:hypothetical protein
MDEYAISDWGELLFSPRATCTDEHGSDVMQNLKGFVDGV